MIVRTTTGRGFGGLIAYITHDAPTDDVRHPESSSRVAWTHTENLPTDDPALAARVMTGVVLDAPVLKQRAGVSGRGRKLKDPCFHLMLAWAPGENHTKQEMLAATTGALKALGLDGHQAVITAHTDRDHQHVHAAVNRVSTEDGRAVNLRSSSLVLSAWAEEWEREHGGIRIQNRVDRHQARAEGRKPPPMERPRTGPARRSRLPAERRGWNRHYQRQRAAAETARQAGRKPPDPAVERRRRVRRSRRQRMISPVRVGIAAGQTAVTALGRATTDRIRSVVVATTPRPRTDAELNELANRRALAHVNQDRPPGVRAIVTAAVGGLQDGVDAVANRVYDLTTAGKNLGKTGKTASGALLGGLRDLVMDGVDAVANRVYDLRFGPTTPSKTAEVSCWPRDPDEPAPPTPSAPVTGPTTPGKTAEAEVSRRRDPDATRKLVETVIDAYVAYHQSRTPSRPAGGLAATPDLKWRDRAPEAAATPDLKWRNRAPEAAATPDLKWRDRAPEAAATPDLKWRDRAPEAAHRAPEEAGPTRTNRTRGETPPRAVRAEPTRPAVRGGATPSPVQSPSSAPSPVQPPPSASPPSRRRPAVQEREPVMPAPSATPEQQQRFHKLKGLGNGDGRAYYYQALPRGVRPGEETPEQIDQAMDRAFERVLPRPRQEPAREPDPPRPARPQVQDRGRGRDF